ncbi:hypothetical protein BHM03_00059652, partial [Ensete ventricosum]
VLSPAAIVRVLQLQALLQLRHHLRHVGPLVGDRRCAPQRHIGTLPHRVHVRLPLQPAVHHVLDVSSGQPLAHPVSYVCIPRSFYHRRLSREQLQKHHPEAIHIALLAELVGGVVPEQSDITVRVQFYPSSLSIKTSDKSGRRTLDQGSLGFPSPQWIHGCC